MGSDFGMLILFHQAATRTLQTKVEGAKLQVAVPLRGQFKLGKFHSESFEIRAHSGLITRPCGKYFHVSSPIGYAMCV
jgi:hypothetical protein